MWLDSRTKETRKQGTRVVAGTQHEAQGRKKGAQSEHRGAGEAPCPVLIHPLPFLSLSSLSGLFLSLSLKHILLESAVSRLPCARLYPRFAHSTIARQCIPPDETQARRQRPPQCSRAYMCAFQSVVCAEERREKKTCKGGTREEREGRGRAPHEAGEAVRCRARGCVGREAGRVGRGFRHAHAGQGTHKRRRKRPEESRTAPHHVKKNAQNQ